MTHDNEQHDHVPANEPETPAPQPAATPPVAEPAAVAAQPVVVAAPPAERWRPGRGVLTVVGAAVGAVLLFGSGLAVGHATGGDHGGHRPMAMRQAGQRGPGLQNQQAPSQQEAPQGPGQQERPRRLGGQQDQQQQPPLQQGGPNQRERQ